MKLLLPVGPRDHRSGPADAAVTLVEYGDFECTPSAMAFPVVMNIRRHYGDKLAFVFRHFPLTEVHPHAEDAAEVAEAAADQGRFWEMHDMLFEHPNALEQRDLLGYANKLGLDVPRILTALAQHVYLPRVQEDRASGMLSGVNATPTFFINGVRFDGEWTGPGFIEALESAMKRNDR